MSLKTPLKKARGLGSAQSGVHHWWALRLSSIALIPLSVWFVASLLSMTRADYFTIASWIQNPLVATLLVALIIATFYHAALGMQVVIEDYVHTKVRKYSLLFVTKGGLYLLGILAVVSVLKIAFMQTISL